MTASLKDRDADPLQTDLDLAKKLIRSLELVLWVYGSVRYISEIRLSIFIIRVYILFKLLFFSFHNSIQAVSINHDILSTYHLYSFSDSSK